MTRSWIAVVVALVVGCDSDRAGQRTLLGERGASTGEATPLFTEGQGPRNVRTVAYDIIWSFGGAGDTLLSAPSRLAAAPEGGVYVLDLGSD